MPPETGTGTQADQSEGATDTQAVTGTQPPAGTSTAQAAGESGEPETISLDEARKLRSENRSLRDRLRPLEAADRDRKDAELATLPDLEKSQRRVAELEAQIAEGQTREQERSIRVAAIEAASKLGFRTPSIAYRLLDRAEISFAEDGTPKNVEALLRKIAEAEPYLVRDGQPDFGGGKRGDSPSSSPDMNALLRAAGRSK